MNERTKVHLLGRPPDAWASILGCQLLEAVQAHENHYEEAA